MKKVVNKKRAAKEVNISLNEECGEKCNNRKRSCNQSTGCVYGLGFIGSVIYYLSTATGFWVGVAGFFKSLVWPAVLVFELLKFLGV